MRISDWSSDVCSSDLDRLILACPGKELILAAARGHVLPDQHPEMVGIVIIARGLDLDVLAQHVESRLLEEDEVAFHRLLGRRRVEPVGPPALIERAVLEDGDRTSVVLGKSVSVRVDLGGGLIIKKKK